MGVSLERKTFIIIIIIQTIFIIILFLTKSFHYYLKKNCYYKFKSIGNWKGETLTLIVMTIQAEAG